MDLHSGAAFWLVSNGLVPAPPRLGGAEHCDVLIVGAGITGALLADALSADGLDVVVVDRREPGLGSTTASTALLLFEIDVELAELVERIGEEAAEARHQATGIPANPRGRAECHRQASATIVVSSGRRAIQPRSSRMRRAEA